MSLSSILASLGGDSADVPTIQPAKHATPATSKRKAEEQLANGPVKRPPTLPSAGTSVAKRRPTSTAHPSPILPFAANPAAPPVLNARKDSPLPLASMASNRKLDHRNLVNSRDVPTFNGIGSKPVALTPNGLGNPAAASPPKPNSMAARLAAAKARQEAQKAQLVSGLVHKKMPNLSKRERLKGKDSPASKDQRRNDSRSRTGSREAPVRPADKDKDRDKDKQKLVDRSIYKGPAKPTMPAYNGSLGAIASRVKSKRPRNDGYASWSDLSAEEDEEDGYGSDGSSVMEAGAFDVEREEEMTLREAKKDDARELALEERLRAEKQAKLAKLAASAGKKKSIF